MSSSVWEHLPVNEGFVDKYIQALPDRQPGVALDIGSHAGTFAIVMAHKFDKIFAFEPHPDNFKNLVEKTKPYANIKPIQEAISDRSGRTNLYLNANIGAHTIDEVVMRGNWGHDPEKYIMVDMVDLDTFCAFMLNSIRLIKIDVEGAEAFIFKGARKLLECKPGPIIIMELHNIPEAIEDIYHQFADLGYTFTDECGRDNVYPLKTDMHYIIRRPAEAYAGEE